MESSRPEHPAPAAPLAATRRERIVAVVESHGFARTVDLARELGTSEVTIRTDFDALVVAGRLVRVHGGAMSVEQSPVERSFEEVETVRVDAKRAIGARAASLVRDGQCVVLDVGTTTTQIAEALLERTGLIGVTVVTNSLVIALTLEQSVPRFTVVVTGGTLRPLQHSLVNPLAMTVLEGITADIAFIGCTGVDVRHGVTNVNLPETDLKRLMAKTAKRSFIVADGGKMGEAHLGVIGPLASFDGLITAGAEPSMVEGLRAAGITVLEADAPDETAPSEETAPSKETS
ncbi:D-beta-D-heptose 1-phosphate adenosyltransferase [Frondihabitans sucicola]|uniref:D-beta-D-heptose 1-phosphate adenosyltransferase n=1 Tax=Frondihabitans sucicola TaxID=1268041 RepID=A0ABN6XZW1_9MICO|nr:DeoR/GlpR family DNA-binding transcription regulator [Frondihabitans sucicola]BDZ49220.1 D-beta-D-heptose 1-phosphate adenosyltransferase [Frondihabitans sucicola]